MMLIIPYLPAVLAVLVTVLAAAQSQHGAKAVPASDVVWSKSATSAPVLTDPVAMRILPAPRILAGVAGVGGVVGVVYALTGSAWAPGASDGTVAMSQGITIGLVSAVLLLSALGVRRASGVQGPTLRIWEAMAGGMLAASGFGGAAMAWILIPALPGTRATRVLLGVIIGAVVPAFLGMMIVPMLVFVIPVAAVVLMSRPRRKRPRNALALPVQAV